MNIIPEEFRQVKYDFALNKTKELIEEKRNLKVEIEEIKTAFKYCKYIPEEFDTNLKENLKRRKNELEYKLQTVKDSLTYMSFYLKYFKSISNNEKLVITKIDNIVKAKLKNLIETSKYEDIEHSFFNFPVPVLKYIVTKEGDIFIVHFENNFKYSREKYIPNHGNIFSFNDNYFFIEKSSVLGSFDNMEEAKEFHCANFLDKIQKKLKKRALKSLSDFEKNLKKFLETTDRNLDFFVIDFDKLRETLEQPS